MSELLHILLVILGTLVILLLCVLFAFVNWALRGNGKHRLLEPRNHA